ncbi:MAG: hypothetical protein ABI795_06380 [Chthoniobacterales bacterium]
MKTFRRFKLAAAGAFLTAGLTGSVLADSYLYPGTNGRNTGRVRYVKVTGSLIPQAIQLKSIGTATYSNLRVIGRREIDHTGRFTTAGVLAQDPSVNVQGSRPVGN